MSRNRPNGYPLPSSTRSSDAAARVLGLLLADGRFPVGGHTQSGGLEPALTAGLTAAQIPGYLRTRLRTVVRVEAGTAVVARSVALAGGSDPAAIADGLRAVERAWRARTPSSALRANALLLGRGLAAVGGSLWPEHPAVTALSAGPLVRPVALGAIAAACGVLAPDLAGIVGYDDVQTVAAAAVKLLPLDPTTATGWVVGVATEIAALAHDLAGLTDPQQIPATAAPAIEEWAQTHQRAEWRLFNA